MTQMLRSTIKKNVTRNPTTQSNAKKLCHVLYFKLPRALGKVALCVIMAYAKYFFTVYMYNSENFHRISSGHIKRGLKRAKFDSI